MKVELNGIQDLIFSDRYALKEPDKDDLKKGDKVIVVISTDGEWEQRSVGVIEFVNESKKIAQIKLMDTEEFIERPFTAIDKCLETKPSDMWDRMAKWLPIKVEKKELANKYQEEFGWLLNDFKFVPGGRINASLGSEELKYLTDSVSKDFDGFKNTLYNCFCLNVEPDNPIFGMDSRESIMDTMKSMVSIQSLGGGVGIPLSVLRPNNAYIQGVNGKSSGAVSWGALFSEATSKISQGGCIHHASTVLTDQGYLTARELYNRLSDGETIRAWTHLGWEKFVDYFDNGVKEVFEVTTEYDDYVLNVTPEHKILIQLGRAGNLRSELAPLYKIRTNRKIGVLHTRLEQKKRSRICRDTADIDFIKVKKITSIGEHQVYDFTVENTHMFWVDGFYVSNSRRGATLLGLNINHPDVVEFIFSKVRKSEIPRIREKWGSKFPTASFVAHGIENANISVLITDDFMKAVDEDKDWDLVFPDYELVGKDIYNRDWDGDIDDWRNKGYPIKVYDTVKARDLWDCIAESAWRSAEPGLIFIDRMNNEYNGRYFEKLICTNP